MLASSRAVARELSEGRWTHDFPIDVDHAGKLGIRVSTDLPDEVRHLMRLYPQARNRRPSVEYIPIPYDGSRPSRTAPDRQAPARPTRT